jgi:hypothetical protein
MSENTDSTAQLRFGRVNVALLGASMLCLAGGYALLARGSMFVAPILLVLGYCVLFPLGLVL